MCFYVIISGTGRYRKSADVMSAEFTDNPDNASSLTAGIVKLCRSTVCCFVSEKFPDWICNPSEF